MVRLRWYNKRTMSPFRHTTLYLAEYISLESARAESGLSAEELSRAMALGLIASAEIGNAAFVEKGSLLSYLERRGKAPKGIESKDNSSPLSSYPDWVFDKNGGGDTAEEKVFRDALVRDRTTHTRASLLPLVFVGTVAMLTLVLSVPFPRDHASHLPALMSQNEISAFTHERIHTLLARSNEAHSNIFRTSPQFTFASEGFGARDQQAADVSELSDPISLFIQDITARIHELVNALFESAIAHVREFVNALLGR
jgi:hypothetical protein